MLVKRAGKHGVAGSGLQLWHVDSATGPAAVRWRKDGATSRETQGTGVAFFAISQRIG
jgi:hypothetical protein